jgi:ferredoxin
VKISIDTDRCSGHGRCYAVAPELFVDDDAGYGQVIGDGTVPEGMEEAARLAALSCPEQAVLIQP